MLKSRDGLSVIPIEQGVDGESGQSVAIPCVFDGRKQSHLRLTLPCPPREAGQRLFLRVPAAATEAGLSCEGADLGTYRGDWVPREWEIPNGADSVDLRVNSLPDHPTRGFLPTCGLVHGGLWQGASWILTGSKRLRPEDVCVRLDPTNPRVEVMGVDGDDRIRVRILSADSGGKVWDSGSVHQENSLSLHGAELGEWSPEHPVLYGVEVSVFDESGQVSDRVVKRVGFRRVVSEGSELKMAGAPIGLRGLLDWGYAPERGAPHVDRGLLHEQMQRLLRRGFNCLKVCLWIPPSVLLEVADELGVLIWQEYPLWLKPLSGDDLVREYQDWFVRDRHHPSIVLRTLTCENDALDQATLDRVMAVARRDLPGELILDNSAWLGISKVGDFYDEHPYLHCGQWDSYLDRTKEFLSSRPQRPLLLGESMCADTLPSIEDSARRDGPAVLQYRQSLREVLKQWHSNRAEWRRVEEDAQFVSQEVRRYQIGKFRMAFPSGGYVMNSVRDIPSCPVGLADTLGFEKFRQERLFSQGDTMMVLESDRRSAFADEPSTWNIGVAHSGFIATLEGALLVTLDDQPVAGSSFSIRAGEVARAEAVEVALGDAGDSLRCRNLAASIKGGTTETTLVEESWQLWAVPRTKPDDRVMIAHSMAEARPSLESGGSVILLASHPHVEGWRAPENVYWSTISRFAPHPLWADPELRRMVLDLLSFDLLSGRVLHWDGCAGMPVLEIVDLHGTEGVARRCPLILETRCGAGRLLVSALEHEDNAVGAYLLARMADVLLREEFDVPRMDIPAPTGSIHLAGPWRRESNGTEIVTGTLRRNQGRNAFCGFETFHGAVEIPERLRGEKLFLRAEAMGDAYSIDVNGRRLIKAGDDEGVLDGQRDIRRTFDVTKWFPVGRHEITVRVRDWRGAGGLIGPLYLTPLEPDSTCLM